MYKYVGFWKSGWRILFSFCFYRFFPSDFLVFLPKQWGSAIPQSIWGAGCFFKSRMWVRFPLNMDLRVAQWWLTLQMLFSTQIIEHAQEDMCHTSTRTHTCAHTGTYFIILSFSHKQSKRTGKFALTLGYAGSLSHTNFFLLYRRLWGSWCIFDDGLIDSGGGLCVCVCVW